MSENVTAATELDDRLLPPHPPTDTPGGIDLTFRPDIEGLRAVAVILVVLYHSQITAISGGFVGVDVFFVLSGFLITGLLLKEHSLRGKVSILGFYARRTRRILPAAMTVIVLTVLASYFIQNFLTYGLVAQDGRWATLFAANFHFAIEGNNYFNAGNAVSPLQHYWSLAVEEQFYLVWPLLVLLVGLVFRRVDIRTRVLVIAVAGVIASFVWSVTQTGPQPVWSYYSPFTRAWELGLGAVLAALVPHLQRIPARVGFALAWLGLIAITVSAFEYSDLTSYPGSAALVPVLGACAVVAGGAGGLGARHLLALRPVRSIGRVSYGWYLLHYPLMVILTGALWLHPLSIEENLVISACTLAGAYLMYFVLERPIRRSVFLARHPLVSVLVGATFVLAAFLVCWLVHPSIHTLWHW
jgi:peptidoglycan/LPS O-acetylase OafA/YrhL